MRCFSANYIMTTGSCIPVINTIIDPSSAVTMVGGRNSSLSLLPCLKVTYFFRTSLIYIIFHTSAALIIIFPAIKSTCCRLSVLLTSSWCIVCSFDPFIRARICTIISNMITAVTIYTCLCSHTASKYKITASKRTALRMSYKCTSSNIYFPKKHGTVGSYLNCTICNIYTFSKSINMKSIAST